MGNKISGLEEYVQFGWSNDLKPWGLSVAIWYNPFSDEFAFMYKHKSGAVHIAKSYEEQVAVHQMYGIPIVPPGEDFKNAGKAQQMILFGEEVR